MDNNGTLEIIAGNDDGNLHVLNHQGLETAFFDTGDDIRGGISIADLDDDGSLELLFVGYDDMIHVWNPIRDEELEGWPINMGDNSLSGPVLADLDNDGDYELVFGTTQGLQVIDIKSEKGSRGSWKLYRGNLHRSGLYNHSLLLLLNQYQHFHL